MPNFLSADLERFARELTFAPPARRRQQIDSAEQLYWHIEPDRTYPVDFIVFRVTGYRPDDAGDALLAGQAVRRDLLLLVESLSGTLDEKTADYDPPAIGLEALCGRLNVTAKTVSRYRRDGLFARRLLFPDGRRRLAFTDEAIARFTGSRAPSIERAARFSRIDEPTRHRIIMRARRITSRADVSPYRVATHLAARFGRSVESIRQLLLRHDRRDPRVAIFPDHTPPLSPKQHRVIARAYHRGVPVARLARRFNRARNAIYRAINRRRADALRQIAIRFVASPTFDRPDADDVILGSPLPVVDAGDTRAIVLAAREQRIPANALAAYARDVSRKPMIDADTEQRLFIRYNYLKFRSAQLRDSLDKYQPQASRLDRAETYLRRAIVIKQTLAEANLRLVVSVAMQHTAGSRKHGESRLLDLINTGNLVLLQAIDTFDVGQGNRFSTYLTYALMRAFAQFERDESVDLSLDDLAARSGREYSVAHDGVYASGGPRSGVSRALAPADDPSLIALENTDFIDNALPKLLAGLKDRERFVIVRRFGLTDPDHPDQPRIVPQTLTEVARVLGVSDERVRQIEQRAVRKLRRAAGESEADDAGDD